MIVVVSALLRFCIFYNDRALPEWKLRVCKFQNFSKIDTIQNRQKLTPLHPESTFLAPSLHQCIMHESRPITDSE